MKLVHDLPENRGVENGIKRAKQMTAFRWTPVAPLPAVSLFNDMENEKTHASFLMKPWWPQIGMVYSSVLLNQKFIGFNVSFESFVSALSDPNSVIYKYNVDGKGRKNANCWYGIVCSCFASYVFDMKKRWICKRWPSVKNVTKLGQPDLNDLKLLDIVLHTKKHIAVITDILRDESGMVKRIEVSESTLPVCRSTYFTPEEFRGYWYAREFEIYRKGDIQNITYTPSPFVRVEADPERGITEDPQLPAIEINKNILPDQGNKTNYRKDQEVVLDILRDGWDHIEVISESGSKEVFSAGGANTVIPLQSDSHAPGFYTARAISKDGTEKSDFVEYAITGALVSFEDSSLNSGDPDAPAEVSANQEFKVYFSNEMPDSPDFLYIHVLKNAGEKNRFAITETDRRNGYVTVKIPEEEETYFMFVTAENKYGEYTSNYLYFRTERSQSGSVSGM